MPNQIASLVRPLLDWFSACQRILPWRENQDPYRVWVSEIMLQQTRVEAVIPYYHRFLQRLPNIQALADCPEEELLKLWEGLGYYNRVRNLQKAAKVMVEEYGGEFPRTWEQVRSLPGIGDYTAGAICSIAFDQPTPAVDGNVLRVLGRITDDHRDVTQNAVKQDFTEQLRQVYPQGRCGDFTQSLMELGAIVCLPNGMPLCDKCPVREMCLGYERNTFLELPVKPPKKARRKEQRTILILYCQGKYALQKRPDKGLLAGLWEFPNLEGKYTKSQLSAWLKEQGMEPLEVTAGEKAVHIFSHIEWQMSSFHIRLARPAPEYTWADRKELAEIYSLPSAYSAFLGPILRGEGQQTTFTGLLDGEE